MSFSVSFRYKGEPDERLYGLKAAMTKREAVTLAKMQVLSREYAEQVVSTVRNNWSPTSPADRGEPPAVDTGNLDHSSVILDRDMSGRFTSAENAKMSTIIWDTRRGPAQHGNGAEYSAVQEYGLDSLKSAHPFLAPAIEEVVGSFRRAVKGLF